MDELQAVHTIDDEVYDEYHEWKEEFFFDYPKKKKKKKLALNNYLKLELFSLSNHFLSHIQGFQIRLGE